ncbi:MAG TPA: YsnF/AvaK domain-containing protein [Silvibacterium sp.]|nr:YsnF/AvaK domain-containing protein [Silvibacterium sp.]
MAQSGTVVGYFPSRTKAESAISALKDAGFTRSNIGLAIRSGMETERETVAGSGERHESMWERIKEFFGGEPTEGSRERYEDEDGSGSYGEDDLHGSLSGMSVDDEQSRYFRHRFGSGRDGAVVTVTAPGREDMARQILEENGGDVGASASSYDYRESEIPARTASTTGTQSYGQSGAESYGETGRDLDRDLGRDSGEQNIRLYGEVLRVHTDRVNRGEARVRKEVHTTTQSVEVPVTREELVVDRVPVTGEQPVDSASFEEKEIRIPLSEERGRVEKQPVVREEVRVGKKSVSDTETFNEQVRNEDLKVDQDVSKSNERKRKTA